MNDVLVNLHNFPPFRTDFNEPEILAARKMLEDAQNQLRIANSNLLGFGEHDNH